MTDIATLLKMRDAGTFQLVREIKIWVWNSTEIDNNRLKEIDIDLARIELRAYELDARLEEYSEEINMFYWLWKSFQGNLDKIRGFLNQPQKSLNEATALTEIKEKRFGNVLKLLSRG